MIIQGFLLTLAVGTQANNNKGNPMSSLPLFIAPASFDNAEAALAQVQLIYRRSIDHLRNALQRFVVVKTRRCDEEWQ